MTKKVFAIDTQPGVQRDGTIFDMNFYTDGRWVRFQRGRPRKIGGYRAITEEAHGYSRGIYVNSVDGNNKFSTATTTALKSSTLTTQVLVAALTSSPSQVWF